MLLTPLCSPFFASVAAYPLPPGSFKSFLLFRETIKACVSGISEKESKGRGTAGGAVRLRWSPWGTKRPRCLTGHAGLIPNKPLVPST